MNLLFDFPKPEPGDYAEYFDDEKRTVAICRRDGTLIMLMNVEDWKRLTQEKPS